MRSSARGREWIVAMAAICSACAHRPASPPPELAAAVDPRCPLPLVWPSPDRTPRRVHIRNATSETLAVVIDRCFRYTSLASLAPGQTADPVLPRPLIGYPDGVRFHALIESQARFVGSWHVAPTPGPALVLVLDTATVARGGLFLYDLMGEPVALRPELHEDDRGDSYLMLPEVADGGFLIWSCAGGRRWVSMSTSVKMPADTVTVATRFDEAEWSTEQRWEVLRSITDAALVPESAVDSFTAEALRAKRVNVRVVMRRYPPFGTRTPPPTTTSFGFRTEELRGMLGGVGCFRRLVRSAERG